MEVAKMPDIELVAPGLHGMYRDRVVDRHGREAFDSGWQHNAIVVDFRRLLAGFARGAPTTTLGIQGLWFGAGSAVWDTAGTPPPSTTQMALVDPNPFLLQRPPPALPAGTSLTFDFLAGAAVSPTPTNRLQIVATLGAGVPAWPDVNHSSATLREFGLVGELDGAQVLLNYRTHPAIARDPFSSLIRTIWLTF
jgi:hypothetical protein